MTTAMANDMERVEYPMHPVDIMGDVLEQHTKRVLNVSTAITRAQVRTMEFGGKDTTTTGISTHI